MIRVFLIISLILIIPKPILADTKLRLITLSPHLAEIVYALGAGDHIVATVEHTDYPEAAKSIRTIGNSHSINIESIIGLKPDLVLAWRTGNPELQLKRLQDLDTELFYSKPENISELITEINQIGRLIGKQQAAEALTTSMLAEITAIEQKYASKDSVSVFYQIWHQPLRSVGNDPWLSHLLEHCAGKNIFSHLSQSFPLVSYEAVLAKNPDIILVPSKNTSSDETVMWQKWSQLAAVKNDHIEIINPDWLHRFTPRITQGLQQLCESIDKVRTLNAK